MTWLLSGLTLTAMYLIGRKSLWGWRISFLNQALWIYWALSVKGYGLVALSVALATMAVYNHEKWRRDVPGQRGARGCRCLPDDACSILRERMQSAADSGSRDGTKSSSQSS